MHEYFAFRLVLSAPESPKSNTTAVMDLLCFLISLSIDSNPFDIWLVTAVTKAMISIFSALEPALDRSVVELLLREFFVDCRDSFRFLFAFETPRGLVDFSEFIFIVLFEPPLDFVRFSNEMIVSV